MSLGLFTPFTPFHPPFHSGNELSTKELSNISEKVKSKLQKYSQKTNGLYRTYKRVLDLSIHLFTLSSQCVVIQSVEGVKSPVKRYEKVKGLGA